MRFLTPLSVFKVATLLAFIYFTNKEFLPRLNELIFDRTTYAPVIIFILMWGVGLVSLLIATFQQKWLTRFFWAAVIALTTGMSYGFYIAGGSEIEVLDVLSLWQARHEAGRAFEFFQDALNQAIVVALIGFIIIVIPPPAIKGKLGDYLAKLKWAPAVPIGLFIALILLKSDHAVTGLPQQFAPLSIASAVGYKLSTHKVPERNSVSKAPEGSSKVRHIIYLVDESINPGYIYQPSGKLMESLHNNVDKIADFGVAISGGNCSARSNAILRFGGTRNNLLHDIQKSPTIWQYAKKAGFRTVYIDAQAVEIQPITKPGDYQNYMTTTETRFVDKFYKIKDVETSMADLRLVEIIKSELDTDVPTFIYANKQGAHFPYHKDYPESEEIYKPISTTSTVKDEKSKQGLINAYKNAVRWAVDIFFQKFFSAINLEQVAVIYTSDHGQNLGHPRQPQCSTADRASPVEGMVPLMFMTGNENLIAGFKTAAKNNFNKVDHFSIFPTLLNLFGYSEDIQSYYGSGLLEQHFSKGAAFNTGDIMGILSSDTIWTEVTENERINLLPHVFRKKPAFKAVSHTVKQGENL